MKISYDNFERLGGLAARLGLVLGTSALVVGTGSAQPVPGNTPKQSGGAIIGDNPVGDTDNPLPGGGAGPGKIEQGGTFSAVASGTTKQQFGHCMADMNGDGTVSVDDLFAFFDYFDAMDTRADLIGDKQFGFDDLLAFLDAWDQGC